MYLWDFDIVHYVISKTKGESSFFVVFYPAIGFLSPKAVKRVWLPRSARTYWGAYRALWTLWHYFGVGWKG